MMKFFFYVNDVILRNQVEAGKIFNLFYEREKNIGIPDKIGLFALFCSLA